MNICSVVFINKVVRVYCEYKPIQDRTNWYDGVQTRDFRSYLVDKWGFDFWNQSPHLRQNYAEWAMTVDDEKKYVLFLLRY